ncbi:MAG: NAD(P)/FAD-dependent oxidoreductase [Myxococcota bacterium]
MSEPHIVIVGGGLAGLSTGVYARASGFRTTIVEHHQALGGVCTAWSRPPYLVDGCIHWLTGGPFARVYRELGILPKVGLRTIERFVTLRDARDGLEVVIASDLDALAARLAALAPEDADELRRMVEGARHVSDLRPPIATPPELQSPWAGLLGLWGMRHELPTLIHYRKPLGEYLASHVVNPRLRRLLGNLAPAEAPATFLLMMLGYLEHGWLSRPIGGTAAFRDALVDSYRERGGAVRLGATVEEILVEGGRARGVRLRDGSCVDADYVVSTASAPETVRHLLGGRYGADALERRLGKWKLFQPIVVASYGVELPLADAPSALTIDGLEPFEVGGRANDRLYLRILNDDPCFAPAGHSVVQVIAETDYDWWARRGGSYPGDKERIGAELLAQIDRHLPGVRDAVRMTDVATPLSFWSMARSWRGAFEGWMPSSDDAYGHVEKTLPGLERLYLAGQWVEPGGGVPTACTSGRAVAQLIAADALHLFRPPFD